MNQEMLWVAPKQGLEGASLSGINYVVKELVERGGSMRGVTDISYSEIELVQDSWTWVKKSAILRDIKACFTPS
jgi:hypothetical protein